MPKPATKAEHTALSFKVENIAADIKALKARGVSFHDYDLPGFKTVDHIAVLANEKAPGSRSRSNILCLHEEVK